MHPVCERLSGRAWLCCLHQDMTAARAMCRVGAVLQLLKAQGGANWAASVAVLAWPVCCMRGRWMCDARMAHASTQSPKLLRKTRPSWERQARQQLARQARQEQVRRQLLSRKQCDGAMPPAHVHGINWLTKRARNKRVSPALWSGNSACCMPRNQHPPKPQDASPRSGAPRRVVCVALCGQARFSNCDDHSRCRSNRLCPSRLVDAFQSASHARARNQAPDSAGWAVPSRHPSAEAERSVIPLAAHTQYCISTRHTMALVSPPPLPIASPPTPDSHVCPTIML